MVGNLRVFPGSAVSLLIAGLITSGCSSAPSAPMAPSSTERLSGTSAQAGSASIPRTLSVAGPATASWSCMTDSAHTGCALSAAAFVPPALMAPNRPFSLAQSVSGSTVTLTWGADSQGDPATSFIVEAGSGPGLSNLVVFDTGSAATTFVATGVPNGSYTVRVRAKNSAGTSSPSNEIVVTVGGGGTCTQPPLRPTNLTATANGSTVTVSWTAPNPPCTATSYEVRAGSQPGTSNIASFNTGSTATSLTATGVPNGTYYIRVGAVNQFGLGVFSDETTLNVGGGGGTIAPGAIIGTWSGGRTVTIVGVQTPTGGTYSSTYQLNDNSLTGTWFNGVNATVTGTFQGPGPQTRFNITVMFSGYSLTGVITMTSSTRLSGTLGPGPNATGQTESWTFSADKQASSASFGVWTSSTGR